MKVALRRFFGVAGVVFGGVVACDAQQWTEPTQSTPLEVVPDVPSSAPDPTPSRPEPEAQACPRPPPGSTPTTAPWVVSPASDGLCTLFPGICMPEGHRRQFQSPPETCWRHEPFGGRSQYAVEYDPKGRLRSFEGPISHGESYRYDDCGRLVSRSYDPPGSMVPYLYTWEYGADGRVLQYTVERGYTRNVTRYDYDASGRLLQAEMMTVLMDTAQSLSARDRFFHDAQGRVIRTEREQDPDDATRRQLASIEERVYDASGELAELRTTSPLDGSSSLKTFSQGRRSRELVLDSQARRETSWAYRPDGLVETEWRQVTTEEGTTTTETRFGYVDASRLGSRKMRSVRLAPDGTETPHESAEQYTYDSEGNLRLYSYRDGATGAAYDMTYEGSCY